MRKFGITAVPVNIAVMIEGSSRILEEHDEELERRAKSLTNRYGLDDLTAPVLKKVYALVLLFWDIFEECRVDAVSTEYWTVMQLGVGAMSCIAYSVLMGMRYVISCESGLHGAVTMSMLVCTSVGRGMPFFGEFTARHPEDENMELLWHHGPFTHLLKKEGNPAEQVSMRQWFKMEDGTHTMTRIDQDNGNCRFLVGVCKPAEGPYTLGTYLWAKFDNLSKQEHKLIEGPYIHHMVETEGGYTEVTREFYKHVPNLEPDWMEQRRLGNRQME